MYDITIVGLGATGVSFLRQIQDELYKNHCRNLHIAVINPSSSFAKGNAFGDSDTVHLLNTPKSMMSMTPTEPDEFSQWLSSFYNIQNNTTPRLAYSDFIQQTYNDIKNSEVLKIDEWRCSVKSIVKSECNFKVQTDDDKVIYSKKVVLSLGALASELFPEFKGNDFFITHFSRFDSSSTKPLLIAGSGLTAVDAFRYARSQSSADIHLYSRNGYIPTCISSNVNYIPRYLTWRNIMRESQANGGLLKSFSYLMRKELNYIDKKNEFWDAMRFVKKREYISYFDFLSNRAKKGNLPFQDILVSTRPYMHKLWAGLCLDEKRKFMNSFSSLWMAWRHPIPQETFEEISQSVLEGKLFFHKSSSPPIFKGGKFILNVGNENLSFQQMWDATGGSLKIEKMEIPLIKSLLSNRLIEGNPCGGINVDPLTFQCKVNDKNINGLYNLGPLSKGSIFSTNAFWFNSKCAGVLAQNMVAEYNKSFFTEFSL